MKDFTPNIPEVVAEVRELFERYEQALETKDVDGARCDLLEQPAHHPLRAPRERLRLRSIHKHRVARPPGPGIKERRIRLEILTLGRDLATVNLEFKVRGHDLVGRQSQTWVRFPEHGWKVVAAHVSTVSEKSFW